MRIYARVDGILRSEPLPSFLFLTRFRLRPRFKRQGSQSGLDRFDITAIQLRLLAFFHYYSQVTN